MENISSGVPVYAKNRIAVCQLLGKLLWRSINFCERCFSGVTITAKNIILQVMLFFAIISFIGANLIKNEIFFMYTAKLLFEYNFLEPNGF
jgi:hypothetical protein